MFNPKYLSIMKNYLLLALAAVALLYAGCKKNDPDVDKPKVVAVTGVSLNTNAVALEVDDSITLTATVAPANATNKGVEWSVADDAIATVKNGVVKAVAIGETTVTVTTVDGGFTASATITVAEGIIKVTGVTLDKPGLELEIGDSDTLTATVAPDDATNKAVSWSSANDAIATVEDGVVTAVAAGETTVTVTTADGAFKATANVVVKAAPIKVTGVSLDKTMVALEIDESTTVTATVAPENATNKNVEWSVANTAIATVIDGVVTGVAAGETTLTVTTVDGGHTATIPVKVVTEKVAVTGITLSFADPTKQGTKYNAVAIIEPANATNTNITLACDDPDFVDITYKLTQNNVVIWDVVVKKWGKFTLTATTEDGGYSDSFDSNAEAAVLVTSIAITPAACEIKEGENKQLTATLWPKEPDCKDVEWRSSNTSIATVDANGLVTGIAEGEVTITAKAKDIGGVEGTATVKVKGDADPTNEPTSITFDGKTDQEIYTWWGKEVDLKAEITPDGASLKTLTWQWIDPSSSSNPDGLKYNVTDDKATLTYTWPSQTSKLRGVNVRAFYGDGNTVNARANVYFQTFAWLLKYSEDAINYDGLYPLSEGFNYKYNWDNKGTNKLAFIAYYRSDVSGSGNENALPLYYKEYYIPTSEYTLTSSDPSKVKVTKSADGESWDLERLNTTDLVAVTLTYKCGSHTETYTINLIP